MRTARELVHKWSRPLFYDEEREAEKREIKQRQMMVRHLAPAGRAAHSRTCVYAACACPGDALV